MILACPVELGHIKPYVCLSCLWTGAPDIGSSAEPTPGGASMCTRRIRSVFVRLCFSAVRGDCGFAVSRTAQLQYLQVSLCPQLCSGLLLFGFHRIYSAVKFLKH